MYIDRILFPVHSLGMGNRIVLFTMGCNRYCKGCSNPELWEMKKENEYDVKKILSHVDSILKVKQVDGVTITGGEPFLQAQELYELTKGLKERNLEMIVFSGFLLEQLQKKETEHAVLKLIDILIDGAYEADKNDKKSALRGSTNQTIYFLNPKLELVYEQYLKQGRQVQNFYNKQYFISVGIPDR